MIDRRPRNRSAPRWKRDLPVFAVVCGGLARGFGAGRVLPHPGRHSSESARTMCDLRLVASAWRLHAILSGTNPFVDASAVRAVRKQNLTCDDLGAWAGAGLRAGDTPCSGPVACRSTSPRWFYPGDRGLGGLPALLRPLPGSLWASAHRRLPLRVFKLHPCAADTRACLPRRRTSCLPLIAPCDRALLFAGDRSWWAIRRSGSGQAVGGPTLDLDRGRVDAFHAGARDLAWGWPSRARLATPVRDSGP